MSLSVVGGGSIPRGHTRLSSSAPLVRLTADDAGVRLVVRSRLSSRFFSFFAEGEMADGRISWSAAWAELERAQVARRSVILHARGKRPSRFGTPRSGAITELAQVLEARGVPVERVRTTSLWRHG